MLQGANPPPSASRCVTWPEPPLMSASRLLLASYLLSQGHFTLLLSQIKHKMKLKLILFLLNFPAIFWRKTRLTRVARSLSDKSGDTTTTSGKILNYNTGLTLYLHGSPFTPLKKLSRIIWHNNDNLSYNYAFVSRYYDVSHYYEK